MLVNGIERTMHGNVLLTLADTIAAHQLGGFKIGVGFAHSRCRQCMKEVYEKNMDSTQEVRLVDKVMYLQAVHNLDLLNILFMYTNVFAIQFTENEFCLRNPATYDHQCTLLNGPEASENLVKYGILS